MPENLRLESSEEILRFMKQTLVRAAMTATLGVRTVTASTSMCKVLLDYESLQELEKRVTEPEEARHVKAS